MQSLGHTATWLEDYDEARQFLQDVVGSGAGPRRRCRLDVSSFLPVRSRVPKWPIGQRLRSGCGVRADLERSRGPVTRPLLAWFAWPGLKRELGKEDDCRAHLTEAAAIYTS